MGGTQMLPQQLLQALAAMMARKQGQNPGGTGATPPFMPPQGGQPSSSPYNIRQDPNASVGNMPKPIQRPEPTEMQGSGPIGTLISLLGNWNSRKQKKENTEAANAAQELMQAIEGAKQTGDWAPAESILHENEKLFNKVYKGWLQKSEMKQKESQKPEKVDPEVQGFEAGVSQYMQKKQQPQQGQPPSSMGGYQLPRAGQPQAQAQQKMSAERQAVAQDPNRALGSQLTSGEQREAQLGAGPEKVQAEIKKYASEVQKAQSDAERAMTELKIKESEALTAKEKRAISLAADRAKTQKSLVDLDIARARLQTELARGRRAASIKTPPASLTKQYEASNQAEAYLQSMIDQKASGFSNEDIQKLQGLLMQAGSSTLAKSLPSWFGSRWFSGSKDIQSLLSSVQAYKTSLSETLKNYGKPPKEEAGSDEGEDDDEETPSEPKEGEPMEGDIIDGYRFKGGDPANQANYEKVTPEKKPN